MLSFRLCGGLPVLGILQAYTMLAFHRAAAST